MKYINSRELFLQIITDEEKEKFKINEALQNEITWGDSLVGRMLASIFRMGGMGIDMLSMKRYLSQLERVIQNDTVEKTKEESQKFKEISDKVEDGSIVDGLNKTIKDNPSEVGRTLEEYRDVYGDEKIDNILNLVSPEFKLYLEVMEKLSLLKSQNEHLPSIITLIVKNLTALKGIMINKDNIDAFLIKIVRELKENIIKNPKEINEIKIELEKYKSKFRRPEDIKALIIINNNLGDMLKMTNDVINYSQRNITNNEEYEIPENKKFVERLVTFKDIVINTNCKSILGKEIKRLDSLLTSKKLSNAVMSESFDTSSDSSFLETFNPYIDNIIKEIGIDNLKKGRYGSLHLGNETNQLIGQNDKYTTEAYKKTLDSINKLMSNDKNIQIDEEVVSDWIENIKYKKEVRDYFITLYKNIDEYVLNIRPGVSEPTPLYENMSFVEDINKITITSEKMARFTKRARQFVGENLYGGLGELGRFLKMFNETYDDLIMKLEEYLLDKKSKDLNVDGKFTLNDEGDLLENGRPVDMGKYIEDYNKKPENDVRENDVREVEKEVNPIVNDVIKYNTINFIDVLRIFSKATRKMTVNNVPSVRSGGKMTVRRSNNWESINGSGVNISGNSSGPFRNIKLFNIWNDGVLKIMRDNDEIIKNATLVDSNGNKLKSNALSKFMSDALDDSKLFTSLSNKGSKGYQNKYLYDYFGIKSESEKLDKTESEKNTEKENRKKYGTFMPTEEFEIDDYVYNIKGEFSIDENSPITTEIFLTRVKNMGVNNLYKFSTSDDYLKAYLNNYKVSKSNLDAKVNFLNIENGQVFDIETINKSFKTLNSLNWETDKIKTINILDITSIEKTTIKKSFNKKRKYEKDFYPLPNTIKSIILKLKSRNE